MSGNEEAGAAGAQGGAPRGPMPWKPTLRLTIAVVISLLILVSGVLIIAVSYSNARATLLAFSDQVMVRVQTSTRDKVLDYLAPAEPLLHLSLELSGADPLEPARVGDTERLFYHALRAHPTVNRLFYGDVQGRFLMVTREPDGSLSTKLVRRDGDQPRTHWRHRAPNGPIDNYREKIDPVDRFDPRTRPWYEKAEQAPEGAVAWTDVYVFHTGQQPGITAGLADRDHEANLAGVVGVDVALADLSHYLARIPIEKGGTVFLMDERRRLVAIPGLVGLVADGSTNTPRSLRLIAESTLPEVACLGRDPSFETLLATQAPTQDARVQITCGGSPHVAALSPIRFSDSRQWRVGVILPEEAFTREIKRANIVALGLTVCIVLLALVVGLLIARVLARSLRLLVAETESIRDLDLMQPTSFATSFREVYEVLQAFDRMKVGLRAFGKFAPAKLVRILLEQHVEPELGGTTKELTVLFTDIRGFTNISEALGPQDLATKHGAYLTAVTDCIRARQGTVDKYIGDSVMAFWNAPLNVRNHPEEACWAALAILEETKKLETTIPDFPTFYTRIGIHTGEVMVGNFGSHDRLNYTCMGDGVNLASRLEGLNTIYGVQIIISEDTQRRVQDTFETRLIDKVAVKGKKTPSSVYELIGPQGRVDVSYLEAARAYERGLRYYFEQQWEEAIRCFDDALQAYADEPCALVLRARCEQYMSSPPSADWSGVHVMTGKK